MSSRTSTSDLGMNPLMDPAAHGNEIDGGQDERSSKKKKRDGFLGWMRGRKNSESSPKLSKKDRKKTNRPR